MPDVVVDLNADVGEGFDDEPLFALVTSVSIACGGHAGDEHTMTQAVRRAMAAGVSVGAHPGYDDREHLGRRPMSLYPAAVTGLVADQVHALAKIAESLGVRLRHVKPHGALYNQAAQDWKLARAVAAGVLAVDASLTLVGLDGSQLIEAGRASGLATATEGFCDRGYRDDGTLVPRDEPGALIDDPEQAAAQAATLAARVDTLCIHADTPGALASARAVRSALEQAGVTIRPL